MQSGRHPERPSTSCKQMARVDPTRAEALALQQLLNSSWSSPLAAQLQLVEMDFDEHAAEHRRRQHLSHSAEHFFFKSFHIDLDYIGDGSKAIAQMVAAADRNRNGISSSISGVVIGFNVVLHRVGRGHESPRGVFLTQRNILDLEPFAVRQTFADSVTGFCPGLEG